VRRGTQKELAAARRPPALAGWPPPLVKLLGSGIGESNSNGFIQQASGFPVV
jgi:hypothetical protein